MDYEQLKFLIEGQQENPSLDFKADSPLKLQRLAKDLIAMSNVRDGGTIIVGVSETPTGFEATGVNDENLKTYNKDIMKDKLAKYTDPAVDFDIYFPLDESTQRTFVVIKVYPFKELPVICIKDWDNHLVASTIYYRNTNKRVDSSAVSNAHDLRAIVEHAAIKMLNKFRDYGINNSAINSSPQNRPLPDNNEVIKKIHSGGYYEWKILPEEDFHFELKKLDEIIRKCQVRYNWYYPHIPSNANSEKESLLPGNNYLEMESDWGARKEFWRLYEDGCFHLISSYTEDWLKDDPLRNALAEQYPKGENLFYYTTILEPITAVFSFLNRLVIHDFIKGNVRVEISYYNTQNRQLRLGSSERMFFFEKKITKAENITETFNATSDQLKINHLEMSNKLVLKILQRFNFYPPSENVKEEQLRIIRN